MFSLIVYHLIYLFIYFESWSLTEHVVHTCSCAEEQDPGKYSPVTSPAGTIDSRLTFIWVVSYGPNSGPFTNMARTLIIEPSPSALICLFRLFILRFVLIQDLMLQSKLAFNSLTSSSKELGLWACATTSSLVFF